MSPNFDFLLVCVQAYLIQNARSQCLGAPALGLSYGASAGPALANLAHAADPYGWGAPGITGCAGAAYGGAGDGNVAVGGELPVAGATAVAGQLPIIGVLSFGGAVPVAGAVTITGSCACGCGASGPCGIY